MKKLIFSSIIFIYFFLASSCTGPEDRSAWSLQYENEDGITYYAINFIDELNGWIVGYSGTIKKTSDGGKRWILQQSGIQDNLWDIDFINYDHGWACGAGNTLLKTRDGGKTWNTLELSGRESAINVELEFINESHGWMSNNQGDILKTTDGGESWQIAYHNNFGGSRLVVFDQENMYFLNFNRLLRTSDGGITWDSCTVSAPQNYMITEMFFTNPSHGYIVTMNGTGGMIIDEYPVLLSKNCGNSWQTSDYLKSKSGFKCVYFIDNEYGWIAGDNIYKTKNGGESWKLEYSGQDDPVYAKDIFFINKDLGWLINYNGQIYKYDNN